MSKPGVSKRKVALMLAAGEADEKKVARKARCSVQYVRWVKSELKRGHQGDKTDRLYLISINGPETKEDEAWAQAEIQRRCEAIRAESPRLMVGEGGRQWDVHGILG